MKGFFLIIWTILTAYNKGNINVQITPTTSLAQCEELGKQTHKFFFENRPSYISDDVYNMKYKCVHIP